MFSLGRIRKHAIQGWFQRLVERELKEDVDGRSLQPCVLCGGTESSVRWDRDRYDFPIQTRECADCGLWSVNPRPSPDFLNRFYSTKRYRGLYMGALKAPDTRFDNAESKARANLGFIETMVAEGKISLPAGAKVLDFGSAVGLFLQNLRKRYTGISVYGLEPGAHVSAAGKDGIDGCYGDLAELPKDWKFSLITSWHVVEHLWDPEGVLRTLRQRLTPEGKLLIEVPDIGKYEGIRNIHLAHLYHFNPATVTRLLCQAGFSKVEIFHHGLQDRFGMKVLVTP